MEFIDNASERIKRIRKRFLDDIPLISIERAKLYTEKWKETQNKGLPPGVRVALSMKNVLENMTLYIDPDDRIAGKWTENFIGIPVDIERGIWNRVFEIELDAKTMKKYMKESNKDYISYMISKIGPDGLRELLENTKKIGAPITTLGTDTLEQRKINPYTIKEEDKKLLLTELIPYWKGKTLADILEKEYANSEVYTGEAYEFLSHLPLKTAQNDIVISPCAVIGVWQGHLVLDFETILRKGLSTMLKEVQDEIGKNEDLTYDQKDFLHSIEITLAAVIIYSRRLAEKIKEELNKTGDVERRKVLSTMYETCKQIPTHSPTTFREAVQLFWIVKTTVDLAIPFNVHGPGRLDQLFYPFYSSDIKKGFITREEARELLEELVLNIMSHNIRPYSNAVSDFSQRFEGSEPVTIGGLNEEGIDATNDLTYLVLEAADRSKASLNFAVRFHDNSPEELYMRVAEIQYNGYSSISMLNDNVCIEALKKRGITEKDANAYSITGCVDMCSPGKTGGIGFSALLLCRTLDMTLRNGNCLTIGGLINDVGLKTGKPDNFDTFDEFLNAFYQQINFVIQKIVEATTIRDRLFANYFPAPFISAFMRGCFKNKKDVTQGGAYYDAEGILIMNSIANMVDSLYVIKKLIFEQKKFTFKELIEAIDNNFTGEYGKIHKMILNLEGKWGNGNPECDELARKVTTQIFEETYNYKTYRGGVYAPFIISMTSHTYDGRIGIATPDGRLAGKPFAASCNPYNVEKNGPTGVMRSVATLDFEHVCGCAVNIRMHPSGIGKTKEARKKWISLLKTYYSLGGQQLQPTVVSTEVLKAAQQNPDPYRNIIVKVGGYSAYFTDLGKEIQDEVISRTEHITI
jgi:pyruvate formate-lyase/glycerol dehydratase family glycyl radical enzyme